MNKHVDDIIALKGGENKVSRRLFSLYFCYHCSLSSVHNFLFTILKSSLIIKTLILFARDLNILTKL